MSNIDMLALVEGESRIVDFEIKGNKKVEITSNRMVVYDSKKTYLTVMANGLRSFVPINENRIRIQYSVVLPQQYKSIIKRLHVDYDLNSDVTAVQICNHVKSKFSSFTGAPNNSGYFILHLGDVILATYKNVKTSEGKGLFYVTTNGLALETREGIVFDVSFDMFSIITEHKKDKIRVMWHEPNNRGVQKFDLQLDKKERDVALSLISNALSKFRATSGTELAELEEKISKMSYIEKHQKLKINDAELDRYCTLVCEKIYGYTLPILDVAEKGGVQTCMLADIPFSVLDCLTDEDKEFRKQYSHFIQQWSQYYKKTQLHKDEIDRLEKSCNSADEFKKMINTREYRHAKDSIVAINLEHPDVFASINQAKDQATPMKKFLGTNLRLHDEMTLKIYREWCKSVPLQNFEDEYGSAWIDYMLEKLDNYQGRNPLLSCTMTWDFLKDAINERDRNTTTLSNFSAPDAIPKEDIVNNCWHDKKRKMWYVENDSLPKVLVESADSDFDHSQTMIGRRVWGFSEDKVTMIYGFPSILVNHTQYTEDYMRELYLSRDTGVWTYEHIHKSLHYILPILQESDISEDIVRHDGSIGYKMNELRYSLRPNGTTEWLSPKGMKLFCKIHGFADIALNERVRRAVFVSWCAGIFDAMTPTNAV